MGKRWRYSAAIVVVAAGVASLGGTVGAGAASQPPKLDLAARATSPDTVAGGATEVLVDLANTGAAGAAAAVRPSFTITPPAGFTYDGSVDLDRVPGFFGALGAPAGHVSCTRAGAGASCVYAGALARGADVAVLTRFRTPSSATGTRRVAFRIAGSGAAAGKAARATVRIVPHSGVPVLYAGIRPQPMVGLGRQASEVVDVLNGGSTAATSVQLSNLLPASVVGTWRARGAGWTCTGAQGSPPTCSSSRAIQPGAFAPQLTIRFTLDPDRVAALHLQIGGKPSVQSWSVGVTSNGGVKSYTVQTPVQLAVAPPPGSLLDATATVARGGEELLPGAVATISGRLSNIGGAAAEAPITLAGTIPAGTSISRITGIGTWSCQGGTTPTADTQQFSCVAANATPIGVAKAARFTIALKVDPDARPVRSAISFTATSANQIAAATPSAAGQPLEILQGNVGFPSLTLLRPTGKHGAFQVDDDGAPAKLVSGRPFTERLDVRNAGGAAIAAGATAKLTQALERGARIVSIQAAPGWSCTGTASLSCTVAFGAALPASKSLTGPVVVIDAGAATKAERSWPATIRLEGADAPHAYTLPVLVTVTHGDYHLIPDFTNMRVPTAGGTGEFGLSVRNTGDIATPGSVVLSVHLPHGVRFVSLTQRGWACETVATSARCTSAGTLQPGGRLPQLALHLAFAKSTELKTVSLEARATVGSRAAPKSARAAMPVEARHALRAVIKDPDKIAFADQPLVKAHEKLKPSEITLDGDGSGGSGLGLRYRWTERSGPAVDWLGPRNEGDVSFDAPQVTKPTPLVFALTVSDGSATSTTTARVKIMPLPKASSGFDFDRAKGKKEKPNGPLREQRTLPKPAEKLKQTTNKTPRAPATSNAPTDTTTPTTTEETTTGETTTGETTTGESGLPAIFCEFVRDAISSSGSFHGTVGGVSFGFDSVTVSSDSCSSSTTISFSGSSFSTSSLKADGVSGSISAAGLTISGGTLTGPEAWHSPTFTLGGAGLSIPFGAGSVALTGTIEADGFAFVPLPSGWNGSTTLTFSAGSSGTSVSVDTTATGPKSDGSPDSPAPTAEIQGAIASDGTFSLTVDVQQIVQLAGSPVNLHGSVKRESPDGAISSSFEGSITKPITIVPGLDINTLTVKMEPTDDSLGLTGTGSIGLSTPNGTVGVDVELAYDNPKNWSLTATGSGDATWNPLPGLTIAAKDFSGAIVAKDDKYDLTLKVAPSADWKPSANVTISNLQLSLSNQCTDTGAACPEDAAVFLDLSGDVAFNLPSLGTVDSHIAGTLALPGGQFSVKASLNEPLSIGAGIQITNASVAIQRGMTTPSEDPGAETSDSGDYRVDLEGAVSLPGIGQLPTVHASFSNQGWAIAVPLGGFSLPGASGAGSKLGGAVVGWASYATKLDVVDPVTKAVTKIELQPDQFKLTGSFTTPSWLNKVLHVPGSVQARATGIFDPDHNTYSLRMDFTVPGQPYLYGSADARTSVRLDSAFFEIESIGGNFDLSLGGTAAMNVASSGGTGGAAASSANLTIALGYDVTGNTVTGTFSLASQDGWRNALGVPDLTLFNLDLQFGLTLTPPIPLPSIGFGATAQLPPAWQDKLGIVNNAKTTVVANFSPSKPCFGLQVDDPTNTGQTVLSLGSGAVTARAFDVEVAPAGCTVGSFKYAPGVSIAFDGNIVGLSVAIQATLGLNPLTFKGSADIGEFTVAGLTVQKTHIDAVLSPVKFSVNFSGGVSIGGTDVSIAGGVAKTGPMVTTNFKGTLNQLNLGSGAVTAKDLAVTIHTETGGPTSVANFKMAGDVTILGVSATGNFTLAIQNGQLNEFTSDIQARVPLGSLVLAGKFHADYKQGQPFSLTANVNAFYAGQALANAEVVLKPGYLQITAGFSVGSIFSAQLAGQVYYGAVPKGATIAIPGGATVPAQTGDFLISAKDVTINVGGFTGRASVYIAKTGSVSQAGLSGSLQVLGGGSGNSVNVSGTIASNGNFTFAGSANLNFSGFTVSTDVKVARVDGAVNVNGTATMAAGGANVTLKGQFAYAGGQYRYRLNGRATIGYGGFRFADAGFNFSNYPEDAGLRATVNLDAGSVISARGLLYIYTNGQYNLSVRTTAHVGIDVNAQVTFSGSTIRPPSVYVQGSVDYYGFGFGVSVYVGSDGSFSATFRSPVSGTFYGETGTVDLGVVRGWGYLSYSVSLTVQSRDPHVSFAGSGSAGIKYQWWDIPWHWPWDAGWGGENSIGVSLSISAPPFEACGYWDSGVGDIGGCIGLP